MADLKQISTETLIRAITITAEGRAQVAKKIEADRANQEISDDLRDVFLATNEGLIRIYDASLTVLRAELKPRLH